jgi:hypothetical protein
MSDDESECARVPRRGPGRWLRCRGRAGRVPSRRRPHPWALQPDSDASPRARSDDEKRGGGGEASERARGGDDENRGGGDAEEIMWRARIRMLLLKHRHNVEALRALDDGMWAYDFDLPTHLGGPPTRLPADFKQDTEPWIQVGHGRDRDMGSCIVYVHGVTGRVARYFICSNYPPMFDIFRADIHQLLALQGKPVRGADGENPFCKIAQRIIGEP